MVTQGRHDVVTPFLGHGVMGHGVIWYWFSTFRVPLQAG